MNFWDELTGRAGSKRAQRTLDQIPGQLHQTMDPYIQRGEQQYGGLADKYSQMSDDPAGFLEKIMGNYRQSEGFDQKMNQMLTAAGNSAAAGGMAGSGQDQAAQARLASQLAGDDMQQWLQNVLGIQGGGMGGQQNFYNQGAGAARGLSSDLANIMGSKANLQSQDKGWLGQILGPLGLGFGSGAGKEAAAGMAKWFV